MGKGFLTMGLLAGLVSVIGSLVGCTKPEKPAVSAAAPVETSTPRTTDEVSRATSAPKANDANALAWSMFRAVAKPGENVFISPASIATAIGLAFEGSSGETRAAAKKFLTLSGEDVNAPLVPSVSRSFQVSDSTIKLEIHNAVWTDPVGIDPTPEYISRADKHFFAKVAKKEFGDGVALSEEINAWVKKSTNSMIDKLVSPSDLKSQHLAVLNAVYFLGTWQDEFETFATRPGMFTNSSGKHVEVPLMNQTSYFSYAEAEKYQLAHLPYKNADYAMSIILPREGVKIEDVESTITSGALENPGQPTNIWVTLPKFKIDWGAKNIRDALVKLGMPEGGPQADFETFGAKENIVISSVIHRAVVKVDEKGTEAAAATAVMARAGSAPSSPPRFNCNRPFLFAIRDVKRNEILFLGRYARP